MNRSRIRSSSGRVRWPAVTYRRPWADGACRESSSSSPSGFPFSRASPGRRSPRFPGVSRETPRWSLAEHVGDPGSKSWRRCGAAAIRLASPPEVCRAASVGPPSCLGTAPSLRSHRRAHGSDRRPRMIGTAHDSRPPHLGNPDPVTEIGLKLTTRRRNPRVDPGTHQGPHDETGERPTAWNRREAPNAARTAALSLISARLDHRVAQSRPSHGTDGRGDRPDWSAQ